MLLEGRMKEELQARLLTQQLFLSNIRRAENMAVAGSVQKKKKKG